MIETLNNLDTQLFIFLNSIRSVFFDYFFGFFSHSICFAIAITFSLIFLGIKELKKKWWVLLILVGLSFLFADRISVLLFKDVFERLRPSHALENIYLVKLKGMELVYDHKGGLYGFVSSHAANAFSLATIFILIGRKYKIYVVSITLWALIIGYSRIYVGVHYPLDVICGGILGIVIGLLIYYIYRCLFEAKHIKNK